MMANFQITAFAAGPLQNKELIEKSGLAGQLKELPGAMKASVEALRQQGAQIDGKIRESLGRGCADRLMVQRSLCRSSIKAYRSFLRPMKKMSFCWRITIRPWAVASPNWKSKRHSLPAQAEIQAFAQKLMADPSKHADRLALYQAIDQTTGAMTMVTEISMNVAIAMSMGMVNAMQGPKVVDTAAVRAEVEKQRFAMTQQIASGTLATMAYAYRDSSIKDLNAYLKVPHMPPAAKKFNAGVGNIAE